MISENLLAAVINDHLYGDVSIDENNIIYYIEELTGTCDQDALEIVKRSINIGELSLKCKVWAINTHNKTLFSSVNLCMIEGVGEKKKTGLGEFFINTRFEGESESEAIFKACEYILNNTQS